MVKAWSREALYERRVFEPLTRSASTEPPFIYKDTSGVRQNAVKLGPLEVALCALVLAARQGRHHSWKLLGIT